LNAKKCPDCFIEMNVASISRYDKIDIKQKRINVAYVCMNCNKIHLNPDFGSFKISPRKSLFKKQIIMAVR